MNTKEEILKMSFEELCDWAGKEILGLTTIHDYEWINKLKTFSVDALIHIECEALKNKLKERPWTLHTWRQTIHNLPHGIQVTWKSVVAPGTLLIGEYGPVNLSECEVRLRALVLACISADEKARGRKD